MRRGGTLVSFSAGASTATTTTTTATTTTASATSLAVAASAAAWLSPLQPLQQQQCRTLFVPSHRRYGSKSKVVTSGSGRRVPAAAPKVVPNRSDGRSGRGGGQTAATIKSSKKHDNVLANNNGRKGNQQHQKKKKNGPAAVGARPPNPPSIRLVESVPSSTATTSTTVASTTAPPTTVAPPLEVSPITAYLSALHRCGGSLASYTRACIMPSANVSVFVAFEPLPLPLPSSSSSSASLVNVPLPTPCVFVKRGLEAYALCLLRTALLLPPVPPVEVPSSSSLPSPSPADNTTMTDTGTTTATTPAAAAAVSMASWLEALDKEARAYTAEGLRRLQAWAAEHHLLLQLTSEVPSASSNSSSSSPLSTFLWPSSSSSSSSAQQHSHEDHHYGGGCGGNEKNGILSSSAPSSSATTATPLHSGGQGMVAAATPLPKFALSRRAEVDVEHGTFGANVSNSADESAVERGGPFISMVNTNNSSSGSKRGGGGGGDSGAGGNRRDRKKGILSTGSLVERLAAIPLISTTTPTPAPAAEGDDHGVTSTSTGEGEEISGSSKKSNTSPLLDDEFSNDAMLKNTSSRAAKAAAAAQAVRHYVDANHVSNLFTFEGESMQAIQNMRHSPLYRQLRLLKQKGLNNGFVSVKIFQWGDVCQHAFPPHSTSQSSSSLSTSTFASAPASQPSSSVGNGDIRGDGTESTTSSRLRRHQQLLQLGDLVTSASALFRGHTMRPQMVRTATTTTTTELGEASASSSSSSVVLPVHVLSCLPPPSDPDAFIVTIELFPRDVLDTYRLEGNGKAPPLSLPHAASLDQQSPLQAVSHEMLLQFGGAGEGGMKGGEDGWVTATGTNTGTTTTTTAAAAAAAAGFWQHDVDAESFTSGSSSISNHPTRHAFNSGTCGGLADEAALLAVDRTRLWRSTNDRFFARFADREHGPVGVLREMLGALLEAFQLTPTSTGSTGAGGVGGTGGDDHDYFTTATGGDDNSPASSSAAASSAASSSASVVRGIDMYSHPDDLTRKLSANAMSRLPRNFTEILLRHYIGCTLQQDFHFLASHATYAAELKLPLCGAEPSRVSLARIVQKEQEEQKQKQEEEHDRNNVCVSVVSVDPVENPLFSPLAPFPAVRVGRGVGSGKRDGTEAGCVMLLRRTFYREIGQDGAAIVASAAATTSSSLTSSQPPSLLARSSPAASSPAASLSSSSSSSPARLLQARQLALARYNHSLRWGFQAPAVLPSSFSSTNTADYSNHHPHHHQHHGYLAPYYERLKFTPGLQQRNQDYFAGVAAAHDQHLVDTAYRRIAAAVAANNSSSASPPVLANSSSTTASSSTAGLQEWRLRRLREGVRRQFPRLQLSIQTIPVVVVKKTATAETEGTVMTSSSAASDIHTATRNTNNEEDDDDEHASLQLRFQPPATPGETSSGVSPQPNLNASSSTTTVWVSVVYVHEPQIRSSSSNSSSHRLVGPRDALTAIKRTLLKEGSGGDINSSSSSNNKGWSTPSGSSSRHSNNNMTAAVLLEAAEATATATASHTNTTTTTALLQLTEYLNSDVIPQALLLRHQHQQGMHTAADDDHHLHTTAAERLLAQCGIRAIATAAMTSSSADDDDAFRRSGSSRGSSHSAAALSKVMAVEAAIRLTHPEERVVGGTMAAGAMTAPTVEAEDAAAEVSNEAAGEGASRQMIPKHSNTSDIHVDYDDDLDSIGGEGGADMLLSWEEGSQPVDPTHHQGGGDTAAATGVTATTSVSAASASAPTVADTEAGVVSATRVLPRRRPQQQQQQPPSVQVAEDETEVSIPPPPTATTAAVAPTTENVSPPPPPVPSVAAAAAVSSPAAVGIKGWTRHNSGGSNGGENMNRAADERAPYDHHTAPCITSIHSALFASNINTISKPPLPPTPSSTATTALSIFRQALVEVHQIRAEATLEQAIHRRRKGRNKNNSDATNTNTVNATTLDRFEEAVQVEVTIESTSPLSPLPMVVRRYTLQPSTESATTTAQAPVRSAATAAEALTMLVQAATSITTATTSANVTQVHVVEVVSPLLGDHDHPYQNQQQQLVVAWHVYRQAFAQLLHTSSPSPSPSHRGEAVDTNKEEDCGGGGGDEELQAATHAAVKGAMRRLHKLLQQQPPPLANMMMMAKTTTISPNSTTATSRDLYGVENGDVRLRLRCLQLTRAEVAAVARLVIGCEDLRIEWTSSNKNNSGNKNHHVARVVADVPSSTAPHHHTSVSTDDIDAAVVVVLGVGVARTPLVARRVALLDALRNLLPATPSKASSSSSLSTTSTTMTNRGEGASCATINDVPLFSFDVPSTSSHVGNASKVTPAHPHHEPDPAQGYLAGVLAMITASEQAALAEAATTQEEHQHRHQDGSDGSGSDGDRQQQRLQILLHGTTPLQHLRHLWDPTDTLTLLGGGMGGSSPLQSQALSDGRHGCASSSSWDTIVGAARALVAAESQALILPLTGSSSSSSSYSTNYSTAATPTANGGGAAEVLARATDLVSLPSPVDALPSSTSSPSCSPVVGAIRGGATAVLVTTSDRVATMNNNSNALSATTTRRTTVVAQTTPPCKDDEDHTGENPTGGEETKTDGDSSSQGPGLVAVLDGLVEAMLERSQRRVYEQLRLKHRLQQPQQPQHQLPQPPLQSSKGKKKSPKKKTSKGEEDEDGEVDALAASIAEGYRRALAARVRHHRHTCLHTVLPSSAASQASSSSSQSSTHDEAGHSSAAASSSASSSAASAAAFNSGSVIGSREDFRRVRGFRMHQHLERLLLQVLGPKTSVITEHAVSALVADATTAAAAAALGTTAGKRGAGGTTSGAIDDDDEDALQYDSPVAPLVARYLQQLETEHQHNQQHITSTRSDGSSTSTRTTTPAATGGHFLHRSFQASSFAAADATFEPLQHEQLSSSLSSSSLSSPSSSASAPHHHRSLDGWYCLVGVDMGGAAHATGIRGGGAAAADNDLSGPSELTSETALSPSPSTTNTLPAAGNASVSSSGGAGRRRLTFSPSFVLLGFGSGPTKKDAHRAAAAAAMATHFPDHLEGLRRWGVRE